MMDTLKAFGLAGFLFFLIKGLMWLVLFALVARGVVSKDKVDRFRQRLRFRKGKRGGAITSASGGAQGGWTPRRAGPWTRRLHRNGTARPLL